MIRSIISFLLVIVFSINLQAQRGLVWSPDGNSFYYMKGGNLVAQDVKSEKESVLITAAQLTPAGGTALQPQKFIFSNDKQKVLLFANTAKVWRFNTRGDYWLYDFTSQKLRPIGRGIKPQTSMFAKFSPDNKKVAFLSEHNIYVDDVATGNYKRLTNDGTRKLINGTFDWVYEEEFGMRDGIRWSPDSRNIAFWQVDATKIRDYFMLNTTDSNYSRVIPVEYPKVGEAPSPVKIGVVNISNGQIKWMNYEGDPRQHYITRVEWAGNNELLVQRLNRKQNESKLIYSNADNGNSATFFAENDAAWVDLNSTDIYSDPDAYKWINGGKEFLWVSEKDGWRHVYKISRDGKTITEVTKGDYDINAIEYVDEANNLLYFTGSLSNATQQYLYSVNINSTGRNQPVLITPKNFIGFNEYRISPNGKFATHSFSNRNTMPAMEVISLDGHVPINKSKSIAANLRTDPNQNVEYMQITTEDNIVLDAWVNKPANFDPMKKYPIVFYVYGEPAASTVQDKYGEHNNFLYAGSMAADGYIQASVDNRGTPMPKGAGWRKAFYKKGGQLNIRDLAQGAKKILDLPYVDKTRSAVWGWSGGGASTLNLMFQYPDLFQTGIAIAAVTNLLNYDNIYTERYMGLPQEDMDAYVKGSPITYAKNLKGNLLVVHGTGDDNVHYSNAEQLVNALVANGKQFEFFAYPNRTHNISEGAGTFEHLQTLYTNFLRKNCAPGGR